MGPILPIHIHAMVNFKTTNNNLLNIFSFCNSLLGETGVTDVTFIFGEIGSRRFLVTVSLFLIFNLPIYLFISDNVFSIWDC